MDRRERKASQASMDLNQPYRSPEWTSICLPFFGGLVPFQMAPNHITIQERERIREGEKKPTLCRRFKILFMAALKRKYSRNWFWPQTILFDVGFLLLCNFFFLDVVVYVFINVVFILSLCLYISVFYFLSFTNFIALTVKSETSYKSNNIIITSEVGR